MVAGDYTCAARGRAPGASRRPGSAGIPPAIGGAPAPGAARARISDDPPHPFADDHDFAQLELVYGHADSYDSYAAGAGGGGGGSCNAPPGKGCNKAGGRANHGDAGWGMSLGRRGRHEGFLKIDADGTRHLTFVHWIEGR